jgi:hypothetical protein
MKHDMENVIARRVYFRAGDKTHSPVVHVEIGTPMKSPHAEQEYMCSYRLKLSKSELADTAYGVDALQALQLALGAAESRLRNLSESSDLILCWVGGEVGDLGIRIPTFS